jgi:hypothetical protein
VDSGDKRLRPYFGEPATGRTNQTRRQHVDDWVELLNDPLRQSATLAVKVRATMFFAFCRKAKDMSWLDVFKVLEDGSVNGSAFPQIRNTRPLNRATDDSEYPRRFHIGLSTGTGQFLLVFSHKSPHGVRRRFSSEDQLFQ